MAAILQSVLDDLPPNERLMMINDDLEAEADAIDADALLLDSIIDTMSSENRLFRNLAKAAEGSLVAGTYKNYQRHVILGKNLLVALTSHLFCRIWSKVTDYCVRKGFIKTKDTFDNGPIPAAAPEYFALYIASESVSNYCLNH